MSRDGQIPGEFFGQVVHKRQVSKKICFLDIILEHSDDSKDQTGRNTVILKSWIAGAEVMAKALKGPEKIHCGDWVRFQGDILDDNEMTAKTFQVRKLIRSSETSFMSQFTFMFFKVFFIHFLFEIRSSNDGPSKSLAPISSRFPQRISQKSNGVRLFLAALAKVIKAKRIILFASFGSTPDTARRRGSSCWIPRQLLPPTKLPKSPAAVPSRTPSRARNFPNAGSST